MTAPADEERTGGGSPAAIQLPALADVPRGTAWPAIAGAVLALLWIAAAAWGVAEAVSGRQLNAAVVVSWISAAASPLVLICMLVLLWQRTPGAQVSRMARTTGRLRAEARDLAEMIERLDASAAAARAGLAAQAEQIAELGSATSQRLMSMGEMLREGATLLGRSASLLDEAAVSARSDMGVLLADVPRARDEVQAVGAALADLSDRIGAGVGDLASRLSSLEAAGRNAEALSTGAAAALGRELQGIAEAGALASARIDAAAIELQARIASAGAEADGGIDRLRVAVDTQARALVAVVEQSRGAFEAVGAEASTAFRAKLAELGGQLEALGERLALEDESARMLVSGVTRQLAELETSQVALTEGGIARARALAGAVATAAGEVERLTGVVGASDLATGAASARAAELVGRLEDAAATIDARLAPSAAGVERQIASLLQAIEAAAADIDGAARRSEAAAASVAAAAADARALDAQSAMRLAAAEQGLGALAARLETITAAVSQVSTVTDALAGEAAPRLIEALVRAREVGQQAAERTRAMFDALVPDAAQLAGEAARQAVGQAVDDAFTAHANGIGEAAGRALGTAQDAAALIEARLHALDASISAAEERIASGREAMEQAGDEGFARRLTLLVEALNSTAIDVAKIFSNEVTDAAWAAYLKGDRGVFARRAVRLLDAGEARTIARHYERDGEFRGQVDRYVHDFEAMLRDVLAFRSGTPMGVTLLSSDIGKLYVALAQAIERLRA